MITAHCVYDYCYCTVLLLSPHRLSIIGNMNID